ncbi:crossover junction endodeoxyribonuclease RuvC [Sphingobacterium psychroaquaticum]|uniref:Crossover junction endodeoxyribonuclease RuvC n=1 Tax=Sphingobacterium psychroaquaticum TaxID=561061 RepID=A0A1X7J8N4_9SPHI|nr:crossover junction endodeoxyribonuclease RuvC [Sphingobacterium psychroaquaticum]QBQ40032.1 crossover junction endodeoxyribonuclease RuvC [Sphingobacterium psychroaquaticum]SMG23854.1 Holliday junction endonuclease RuvC [Sphingobacterium psychroaquaticum]
MQREKAKERIILGIDPGTIVLGYGLIHQKGSKLTLISLGVVKMGHLEDQGLKLQRIFKKVSALIDEYKPDCMALEAPFYGKNIQVMLKLGRAQGVAMAAALNVDIPIFEYAPRKIKQSVTGNGSSSKEQVAAMLKNLLKFNESPEFLDATDGLAVAVCHAFQQNTLTDSKSYSGWEAFAKDNQKRIR